MSRLQYEPTQIATAGTTVIAASGNITVHTVTFPRASVGTTTFVSAANVIQTTFPIGSIGSMVLDASYGNGLTVVLGSALDFPIITTDTP